jgi:phospholipase/carboxylesterase
MNPLEFRVRKPDFRERPGPVLVLLHGRGSDMNDLQGLAEALPANGALVTPQAPHPGGPWGYGPGWAWYRYLGEDRAEVPSLHRSLDALDDFLGRLDGILGFQPEPLVLGGFSQGATTSLAYAAEHPGAVSGVVVLSGFLVDPETTGIDLGGLSEKPVFWGHGTQDPAVPFSLALRGRERIRDQGGAVEARDYAMGHWVTPQEISDLKAWLAASIPGWQG